jgi:hypothetical protein
MIETSGASNALSTECKALISNTSPFNLEYYGGGESFFAICTNDVWGQIHIHTLDCGYTILPPGHSVTNILRIPKGATKIKVGFPMTSLTWRGNTAWYLAAHFPSGLFRSLGGFLLQKDESKRNVWVWSDEYSLTNLQAISGAIHK